eukprot:NODE_2646_length_661_cov_91.223856_g2176_i0.p3 GENE.NODE_2646_length_661_cov_91.223856_g2176_i0~~NODE_2646_length_661_cov_91.223856_g2176_i0.p3  ORF type:complete len:70 (-),score=14.31 NODE_2646_length_661_cov_91.223856_g2176_i0:339-548(-)
MWDTRVECSGMCGGGVTQCGQIHNTILDQLDPSRPQEECAKGGKGNTTANQENGGVGSHHNLLQGFEGR